MTCPSSLGCSVGDGVRSYSKVMGGHTSAALVFRGNVGISYMLRRIR